jgi:hypothetical protein
MEESDDANDIGGTRKKSDDVTNGGGDWTTKRV